MEHAQYLYYINKEYKPHLRKHALSMLLSSLSTKTPWFWRFRSHTFCLVKVHDSVTKTMLRCRLFWSDYCHHISPAHPPTLSDLQLKCTLICYCRAAQEAAGYGRPSLPQWNHQHRQIEKLFVKSNRESTGMAVDLASWQFCIPFVAINAFLGKSLPRTLGDAAGFPGFYFHFMTSTMWIS